MSFTPEDDGEIAYALVCLKTGVVLGATAGALTSRLEELAAAAPELFRASAASDFASLFARLGSERTGDSFQEIVVISAKRAHVVLRLVRDPDSALLAVTEDIGKLGLVLSGVRERMLRLEAAP